MNNHKKPARSVEQQIRRPMLTVLGVMGTIVIVLIVTLLSINSQYTAVLQSANTAADFNQEFKEMLDSGMYNHVIRPRSPQSVSELPMDVLDDAVEVLRRLETTTTLRDNRWRVQSMLKMCAFPRSYREF